MLWRVQTDFKTTLLDGFQQLEEILVGRDGGMRPEKVAFAGEIVRHVVGIPIEHAFCDGNVEIAEPSDGIFRLGDVLFSKENGAMCPNICPVGVFGENEGRLVAVPNGHEAGQVVNHAVENLDFAFQHLAFADFAIRNVLKVVRSVGAQGITEQRVVAPIVDVETNGSVVSVELQRGYSLIVIDGDGEVFVFYGKTFSVKVITALKVGCVDVLVAAINGEFAFWKRQLVGQSKQLHVFLECGFDVHESGNHGVGQLH